MLKKISLIATKQEQSLAINAIIDKLNELDKECIRGSPALGRAVRANMPIGGS